MPLGGCFVEASEQPDREHAIAIRHPDFGEGVIYLACDSAAERTEWIKLIHDSARVTYRNAQIGETMIQVWGVDGAGIGG